MNGERQSFEETKKNIQKQTNKHKKTNQKTKQAEQKKPKEAPFQSSSGTMKFLTIQGWVYNIEYYKYSQE